MGIRRGEITSKIISDGLVFNMDPANRSCYPKTGTTATDTINSLSGSLINQTSFSDSNFPFEMNVLIIGKLCFILISFEILIPEEDTKLLNSS